MAITSSRIRRAGAADLATLLHQRRAMFADMGYSDATALDTMTAAFGAWVAPRLRSEEYVAWLAATAEGTVIAGAALWLMDWPPHMVGGPGRRGNLLNVYTEPAARRQGLARRLTQTAMDWCRDHGIGLLILHASEAGRPLYTELGFTVTNEMRWLVTPPQ